MSARCPECQQETNHGRDIDSRTGQWLGEHLCMNVNCGTHYFKVSTEPQGALQGEPKKPGETGGPRNAGSQAGEAQSGRPSWLFPFPMELTDGRRPDAQRDGGVREGDFFEGQRGAANGPGEGRMGDQE
jgi:hypothetical protein